MRAIVMNEQDELRDVEIHRIATVAAERAAEVVRVAATAAHQVAHVAAQAAQILSESTRIDLGYIKADLQEIKDRLDCKFVTLEAFEPIRKVVYGLVGLSLMSVLVGILALVLKGR